MKINRNVWVMTGALLLAAACGDDEGGDQEQVTDNSAVGDSGVVNAGRSDAGATGPVVDAGRGGDGGPSTNVPDGGGATDLDAGAQPDAAVVSDASDNTPDAAPLDAGTVDGGTADGSADTGAPDSGRADGGAADTGTADAGRADAGRVDGGRADAGSTDAGSTDAGSTDAGRADAGATDGAAPDAGARIEVAGRWHSNFGETVEVSDTKWGSHTVVQYDNETRVAITQSPADDEFSANKFNRYVWTPIDADDGTFYTCTIDYGKDTAEEARSSMTVADASNPDVTGCSGFPWSKLSPVIELEGTWKVGADTVTISSDVLGELGAIVSYDNTTNTAFTSSGLTGAKAYGKAVWTEIAEDEFHACVLVEAAATLADAQASTVTADVSNLTTGCLGEAWLLVTRQ